MYIPAIAETALRLVGVSLASSPSTSATSGTSAVRLPRPTRQLEWKDVNFLSTSDTHGWLLGHQHATWPEPNYSGDYGALASFAQHMRALAKEKGVDLLLVDAGDHHDGSGLVSSSAQSAARADEVFAMLPYDVLAIGNHELYKYESAKELYEHKERWRGRFLTSNVNITVEQDGRAVSVPIGERVAKFTTEQGRKVTAFGVIFNFQAHARNLTIHSPTRMSKEAWFLEAIDEEPDYFVLAGHMPARGDESAEWDPVFHTIRQKHPHTPIFIFGGHTHVRDCMQFDDRSIAVVPGRYMETVAFTSSNLPEKEDATSPLDVARRYLDANRQTYGWHSGRPEDFDTRLGWNITLSLLQIASDYKISKPIGLAPQDFFLSRFPHTHQDSLLNLFAEEVLPTAVVDKKRKGERVIIGNAGSVRFDLFQGRFDRNDELTVSPFDNGFVVTRLPAGLARKIVDQMNRAGASKLLPDEPATRARVEARVQRTYDSWLQAQWDDYVARHMSAGGSEETVLDAWGQETLTMGYVTKDACPGVGDDIEHVPVPHYGKQPDFIQSPFPESLKDDEELDVVVMSFTLDDFLTAVHVLDPASNLTEQDFEPYAVGVTMKDVFGTYARKHWRKGL